MGILGTGTPWRAALAAAVLGATAAAAQEPALSVELNRLEPQEKACRTYLVATNPGAAAFRTVKLDLIFFRSDGVIDRRLAVDIGPVRAGRRAVRTFDLDGLACDGLGSVLVNDVLDCRTDAGPVADCLDRMAVSSRAAAQFGK